MMIRTTVAAIIIALTLAALYTASHWDDPKEPLLIEPTKAHACLPPPRSILEPKPGDPVEYRAPRKWSNT